MQICISLVPLIRTNTMADRSVQTFNKDLVEGIFFVHVSSSECFCHHFFSVLGRRHNAQCAMRVISDSVFAMTSLVACFLDKKITICGYVVKYLVSSLEDRMFFYICSKH